ncbi:DUF481 domain-containing protein [Mucilaginibacter robiniae]|uniref:DUF481 domain-containing protein n=1 Tax=Mucilaginibacter robiniae TaxID=2728022 RepID=A0A7L5E0E0_9SPHI|nr:DUF481 domain-containing protein [Mucilaginibacter robiniae]QJD94994.1 DUF481 domain-containing protein [Mucilaginibacter robiniae]
MYKYFTVFIFLFFAKAALAQFNDTTHYHLLLNPSGTINRARDANSYLLNNVFKFDVKRKDVALNYSTNWVYGKANSALSNNDFSTVLDVNLYKAIPHAYYWGLANYNTSYSLKIYNQLLAGGGIAYSILDKPNGYLNISDGILYDLSDIQQNDTTRSTYHTYRNSLRLQFHFLINNIITLDSGNFLQNSLKKGNDYIIRSNFSVGLKLRKWLSINGALNYNKETRTQSETLLVTYGLQLERYF